MIKIKNKKKIKKIKFNFSGKKWLLVFAAIFVVFVFAGSFYVLKTKKSQNDTTKSITQEISKINDGLKGEEIKKVPQNVLKQILTQRKERLLAEIKTNPKALKDNALPKAVRDALPAELKGLVEQEVDTSGKLSVFNVDDFENKKSSNVYTLTTDNGQLATDYSLHFIEKPRSLKSDSQVTVKGLALDNQLVLDSSNTPALDVKSHPPKAITGVQSTLVMRFNFNNNRSTPFTTAQVNNSVFADADSANFFHQENSYSNISFSGAVVSDWLEIDDVNTSCHYGEYGYPDDVSRWAGKANAIASAPPYSYNLANYTRRVYIFPGTGNCPWAGLGEVGGSPTMMWSNGYGDGTYHDKTLFSHELGHNLGVGHASSKDCGAKTIDVYTNCTNYEYGDDYDAMGGNWENYHFNAALKDDLSWLDPGEIQTVSANGTYTLNPIENAGSANKAIRIQKPNTSEYYWLEYRQAVGTDSTLPSGVTRGVIGHIWSETSTDNSYLLDFTPANNWSDVALSDGVEFYDEQNNIRITQTAHNSSTVTLSVEFSYTPPPPPATYVPVYRFWNVNGTHFYTASESEKNNVIARWGYIYRYEGIAYYLNISSGQNNIALWRLWNNNGTHFYTASYAEAVNAVNRWPTVFRLEGIAYYVSLNPANAPVYRFYNVQNGTHFYTVSAAERDNVNARWGYIYRYEGVGYYLGG